MRPSLALEQHREVIRAIVARHRAYNARVFGSVLHGADREGSDLDLLVDAGPDTSLLDLVKAQHEIESIVGVPVDLLTPEDLPESFRPKVLAEARPL
ncbi:MAG: nucleotidyltransferase family protein [Pseudomonadota bacterium]|uniref:nucleotidyltransferase family protein n=1 Tax=Thermithiobacillus tepidarius TaxID=929 RepID=UPI00040F723B|nr:nucleotidyltransferase family protein [Thermithiobacillus tepidarius]